MNTGKVDSVRDYFDDEKRKHPSFLLFDTTPNNFLVPSETYARSLLGEFDTGLKILEIGSNDSVDSLTLAGSRNQVWAIEIAKQRLSLARKNMYNSGQVDQVLPICMDAHRLAFPDNYFDLVVGNSVLLFLDRERFVSECYRVLKPGGRALFSNESMKKHPVLLLRRALPRVRARESVAQRITLHDITLISEHSDEIRHSQFYLFSVLLAPIVARFGHFKPVHQAAKLAYKIDDLILRLIPALRDHCWICVLEFRKTPICLEATTQLQPSDNLQQEYFQESVLEANQVRPGHNAYLLRFLDYLFSAARRESLDLQKGSVVFSYTLTYM